MKAASLRFRSAFAAAKWAIVYAVCAVLSGSPSSATAGTPPPLRLGMELGSSWLGGDLLVDVVPTVELASRRLQIGLGAPLRLRVHDADPKDSCATPGLRCQDWDRWSDWTRLLRHLDIGDSRDPYQLHVGDLTGVTLGHGELLWRYYNNQLFNEWNPGVYLTAQQRDWGFSAVMRNALEWSMAAARASGKPVTRGWWRSLEFGVQAAVERRSRGVVSDIPAGGWRFHQELSSDPQINVVLDLSQPLLSGQGWLLGSWLAGGVQGVDQPALGGHFGLRLHAASATRSLAITAEGRVGDPGYLPARFDPSYELTLAGARTAASPVSGAQWGGRGSLEMSASGIGRTVLAWDQFGDARQRGHLWLFSDLSRDWSLRLYASANFLSSDAARRLGPALIPGYPDQPDWQGFVSGRLRIQGPWYFSASAGRRWFWRTGVYSGDYHPQRAETEVRIALGWDGGS